MYSIDMQQTNQNKMVQTSGRTDLEVLDDVWSRVTKEQRENLLTTMGYHISWAEANTVSEMSKRGGKMLQNELLRMYARTKAL